MKKTISAILFLDFDGTISKRDVTDAILERYADSSWQEIEDDWLSRRIGSRDCLSEQMALVRASRKQLDALVDSIEVDEGLNDLLDFCAAREIEAHIISDGFDYCINRILERAVNGRRSIIKSLHASNLEFVGCRWRTHFPHFYQSCEHGCATCKPALMRLLNPTNAPAIFVGDGLSDRYAVEGADLVFAKNELAIYCRENSIEHIEYESLSEVATRIETWTTARVFRRDGDARRFADLSLTKDGYEHRY